MEQQLTCPLKDRTEPCPIIIGQAQINATQTQVQETCQACGSGCGYTLGEHPSPAQPRSVEFELSEDLKGEGEPQADVEFTLTEDLSPGGSANAVSGDE